MAALSDEDTTDVLTAPDIGIVPKRKRMSIIKSTPFVMRNRSNIVNMTPIIKQTPRSTRKSRKSVTWSIQPKAIRTALKEEDVDYNANAEPILRGPKRRRY